MIVDGTGEQRAAGLFWLAQVSESSDAVLLGEVAADPDPAIRVLALKALPHLDEAFPVLSGALQDRDPSVRVAAVTLLTELGRPAAVALLSALIEDTDRRVRARVAYALGRLGRRAEVSSAEVRSAEVRSAEVRSAARASLRTMLRDGDEAVRARAHEALGEIGGEPAADALLAEADSGDPRQRGHAAKALAKLVDSDPRADARIRSLAGDPDASVRAAVLSGLATVGDITGRWEALVNTLAADPDVTVRHRVAGTAVHLVPYPDEVLTRLAADPSGFVREAAAFALSRRRR